MKKISRKVTQPMFKELNSLIYSHSPCLSTVGGVVRLLAPQPRNYSGVIQEREFRSKKLTLIIKHITQLMYYSKRNNVEKNRLKKECHYFMNPLATTFRDKYFVSFSLCIWHF